MACAEPGQRRTLGAVVTVFASAVLWFLGSGIGTGFVPIGVLAWFAPLPVLLLASRVPRASAFTTSFLAFLLGTANSWKFFSHSGDVPLPMGIAIIGFLSAAFGCAALLHRALLRRERVLLACVVPAAFWVVLLHLIQLLNPTGLMGTFANSQGDIPVVLQTAALAGPWGVEFLVLAVPSALAAACAAGMHAGPRWRAAVCCGLLVVVPLGGGALRLATAQSTTTQRVALVVHNHSGWGVDVATPVGRELVGAYADRITALPGDARTVVLPEGAFSVRDSTVDSLVAPLRRLAAEQHRTIVVGYMHERTNGKLNVALTLPAGGGAPVPYLKWHDTVARPGTEIVDVPGAAPPVGVQVCADLNQPTPSRDYAVHGTGLMLIPAADEIDNGWQHSRMAVLRGVENGFATAWSASRGSPVISDAYGRIHAHTRTGGADPFSTLIADVPVAPGGTPAAALGDWFAWTCWAVAALGVLGAFAPRRTPRGASRHDRDRARDEEDGDEAPRP